MDELKFLTVNWDRSLIIDTTIDDDLVRKLTPKILSLRQASNEPITVGIDSPGGSLSSLDVLISLFTGPSQSGTKSQIITVVTHRAYSAAANFLAFGDYAVAMRHSEVLFHDVRFGGMDDVTPEKARDAAKSLQDANDAFALRLAHKVITRLVWTYVELRSQFDDLRKKYPATHKWYAKIVSAYATPDDDFETVDLPTFATALWAKLSRQNDSLIKNVMQRLNRWIQLTKIATSAPTYRPKGSRRPGLLDGSRYLHKLFEGDRKHFESSEEHLKLLLSLIVADIASTKTDNVDFPVVLERATREYAILNSMNDSKHIRYASNLLSRHGTIFFAGGLDGKTEDQRSELIAKAAPYATLLWHFCVLLCRELFEGEHVLKPSDAQLLGLIDEVCGGGPIESRREFVVEALSNDDEQQPSPSSEAA